jgi:hypothetical protein
MIDLDAALEGLRRATPDPRLDGLENGIMAGVAAVQEKRRVMRTLMMSAVAAVGLGVGTGLLPANTENPDLVMALNTPPLVAPSSLLMGVR